MNPEMRDDVERIVRELQRQRVRRWGHHGNTVMRVAIRLVRKRFSSRCQLASKKNSQRLPESSSTAAPLAGKRSEDLP